MCCFWWWMMPQSWINAICIQSTRNKNISWTRTPTWVKILLYSLVVDDRLSISSHMLHLQNNHQNTQKVVHVATHPKILHHWKYVSVTVQYDQQVWWNVVRCGWWLPLVDLFTTGQCQFIELDIRLMSEATNLDEFIH